MSIHLESCHYCFSNRISRHNSVLRGPAWPRLLILWYFDTIRAKALALKTFGQRSWLCWSTSLAQGRLYLSESSSILFRLKSVLRARARPAPLSISRSGQSLEVCFKLNLVNILTHLIIVTYLISGWDLDQKSSEPGNRNDMLGNQFLWFTSKFSCRASGGSQRTTPPATTSLFVIINVVYNRQIQNFQSLNVCLV